MRTFIQKPLFIVLALLSLTAFAVPFVTAAPAHAADNPGGTCFVVDPGGSHTRACTKSDKSAIKQYTGKKFDSDTCYSITSTTSTTNVTTTDCSGKGQAGTQMCDNGQGATDPCDVQSDTGGSCKDVNVTASNCDLVGQYLQPFINFLAALVGVAVVISIVVGGIQYSSSGGDPSKISAAKKRIFNAIIALITFLFLYAMLNFLIPGGLV